MCHRTEIWSTILLAAGVGLILSCLFPSWFLRLVIGIILIFVGLLLARR